MTASVSPHPVAPLAGLDGHIARWFHAPADFSLSRLRGQVVLVHAFQMLCPGCVLQALPQTARVAVLGIPGLSVIGLHTVFEHHRVMDDEALAVFLAEFRISYPVGVDRRLADDPVPSAMRALALRGTPSTMLYDRRGRLREQRFGAIDDLELGCLIGSLLVEDAPVGEVRASPGLRTEVPGHCATGACTHLDHQP